MKEALLLLLLCIVCAGAFAQDKPKKEKKQKVKFTEIKMDDGITVFRNLNDTLYTSATDVACDVELTPNSKTEFISIVQNWGVVSKGKSVKQYVTAYIFANANNEVVELVLTMSENKLFDEKSIASVERIIKNPKHFKFNYIANETCNKPYLKAKFMLVVQTSFRP